MRRADEFPLGAEWSNEVSRRRFLKLMGASFALAGATACTRNPLEQIVPYLKQPEEIIPGKPLYFASALTLGGYARGVLVESHEGRPTKIEGNPQHPASLGASDVFMQAELLALYDPERSQAVMHEGRSAPGRISWARSRKKRRSGNKTMALVCDCSRAMKLRRLCSIKSSACSRNIPLPNGTSTNRSPRPRALYDLDRAEVIVSLGADFLASGPCALPAARQFAARRDGWRSIASTSPRPRRRSPARRPTIALFSRPMRWPISRGKFVGGRKCDRPRSARARRAFTGHRGRLRAPEIHAAARQLNEALGNIGATIDYLPETPIPRVTCANWSRM